MNAVADMSKHKIKQTLPLLIIFVSIAGITYILYSTTRPGTGVPTTAEVSSMPRNTSPEEKKAAASRIAALKCPEAYPNYDAKMKAFLEFANDYSIEYPISTIDDTDFAAGRIDFLISRHCTSTLMNLGYDGTSPIDATIKTMLIINSMQDNQATSTTQDDVPIYDNHTISPSSAV